MYCGILLGIIWLGICENTCIFFCDGNKCYGCVGGMYSHSLTIVLSLMKLQMKCMYVFMIFIIYFTDKLIPKERDFFLLI